MSATTAATPCSTRNKARPARPEPERHVRGKLAAASPCVRTRGPIPRTRPLALCLGLQTPHQRSQGLMAGWPERERGQGRRRGLIYRAKAYSAGHDTARRTPHNPARPSSAMLRVPARHLGSLEGPLGACSRNAPGSCPRLPDLKAGSALVDRAWLLPPLCRAALRPAPRYFAVLLCCHLAAQVALRAVCVACLVAQ